MGFTHELRQELLKHKNLNNAEPMGAYMKYKFSFLGIKSPERKALLKQVVNNHKDELKSTLTEITKNLFSEIEREFHYCAMEVYARFRKRNYALTDIETIELLIKTHSHWDSVDFIAKNIYGQYLIELPSEIDSSIEKFTNNKDMWLNRSAILFQLGYKDRTDKDLLFALCEQHKDSNEFFIQKAIGWALREYGKVNPQAVLQFVDRTALKPLSKREAIRRIA